MRLLPVARIAASFFLAAAVHAQAIMAQAQSGRGLDFFPRKPIEVQRTGVNAFVNEPRFGTVRTQFLEVRNTLRIKKVRVLFAWNDQVQPSPNAAPNFAFYDEIVRRLPRDMRAFAVLTGTPSWMREPRNWIGGNPRRTFIERWVRPIAERYAKKRKIIGYQIWNEPNNPSFSENETLGVLDSPDAYLELQSLGHLAVKRADPKDLVIMGATTAINQSFPETLEYNRALRDGRIEGMCDVYAIHYYGTHYENLFLPNGVADFLNSLERPIWVTESGEQGTLEQREYVERTWPLLRRLVPGIERLYYYQFTESTHADVTYGLKNPTPGRTVSDLYIYLRDRGRRR